jgi:H+-transporting ATPase
MKNYVIYRVACTVQLLVFFFVAVFVFHPPINDEMNKKLPGHPHSYPIPGMDGETQEYGFTMTMAEYGLDIPKEFNLPVIALVVIVILNDATIISTAYDHVKPSALPERWNLQVLFIVAIWIGLVACCSSLWLLDMALKSEDPSSLIRQFIPAPLSYGQVVAIMYLKISLSDWWTIFAARTRGFFFERAPSTIVLCAASLATVVSTLNSMYWPFQHLEFEKEKYEQHLNFDIQIVGLEIQTVAFTWIFTLIFFVMQDIAKVICYYVLFKFDVCGIRSEQEANDERVRVNNELQEKLKEKEGQPWMKELMALKSEVAELKDMLKKSIGKPAKKELV